MFTLEKSKNTPSGLTIAREGIEGVYDLLYLALDDADLEKKSYDIDGIIKFKDIIQVTGEYYPFNPGDVLYGGKKYYHVYYKGELVYTGWSKCDRFGFTGFGETFYGGDFRWLDVIYETEKRETEGHEEDST